jgi:hypothetical protein
MLPRAHCDPAHNVTSRPERTIEAIARTMSPADAAVVRRPEVRGVLIADITEAFRQTAPPR